MFTEHNTHSDFSYEHKGFAQIPCFTPTNKTVHQSGVLYLVHVILVNVGKRTGYNKVTVIKAGILD